MSIFSRLGMSNGSGGLGRLRRQPAARIIAVIGNCKRVGHLPGWNWLNDECFSKFNWRLRLTIEITDKKYIIIHIDTIDRNGLSFVVH